MKYAGKTYFWRKGKLELPLPCANSYEQSPLQPKSLYCRQSWKNSFTYAKYHVPTLMSKVSCNQRAFIAGNPGRSPLHMQMWKMCVHIAMRCLCSIHIIDAYSSTTTRKMHISRLKSSQSYPITATYMP